MALFEQEAPSTCHHRKLAHRGSYIGRVWVSPSTVDRVLARHGLRLNGGRTPRAVQVVRLVMLRDACCRRFLG